MGHCVCVRVHIIRVMRTAGQILSKIYLWYCERQRAGARAQLSVIEGHRAKLWHATEAGLLELQ